RSQHITPDSEGFLGVVKLLATHGADVTARDRRGWTPLHRAVMPGRDWMQRWGIPDVGIVSYLLREAGADANAKNRDGRTALHELARTGYSVFHTGFGYNDGGERAEVQGRHLAIAEVLAEEGGAKATDRKGRTALHLAAKMGYTAVADVLLKQEGVEVNARDNRGWTPLHWSAARGCGLGGFRAFSFGAADYRGVVELLATHGGDVTAEDDEGWTPIHRAAVPGEDEDGNPVEPDIGILNYLLRETGAIVPLAQNVVKAHYRRERGPVAHRTRGAKRSRASS
ncbi:MAG: ankyrin repeat domain-containing protein, partial [Planctomycetota bacterium]|nr:ankyrin repeat domain-containing protein [Planctomycetota bacterium]